MSANVIIQFRRGTASEWTSADPTLASGEVGLETDTNKMKIGDGSTAWTSLSYLTTLGAGVLNDISDVVISSAQDGDFLRWNGSAWINDAVNLGTDSVGDYVESLVAGTGVSLLNNSGEGATPTIYIGQDVGTGASVTFATLTTTSDVTIGGETTVGGHIIPDADVTYDLGSSDNRFRDLYLSGTSIDLGGVEITSDGIDVTFPNAVNATEFNGAISGNVTGDVTGDLTGNADTATQLETSRNIQLSGDVTGNAYFDGTADITITTQIEPNSLVLGDDTTGDFVQNLVAGTGVSLSDNSGEKATPTIFIGQDVGTGASVTFYNATLTDGLSVGGDATITGNLTVNGTTTSINTTELTVEDNIVLLNSNATTASVNAGIEVERGTVENNVFVRWNETSDRWEFTNNGTDYYQLATSINDIDDVSVSSPSLGQLLVWDGSDWINYDHVLNSMTDVTITSATAGDFLKYDGAEWVNDAINLGTDTVGDYVESLVAGTGVSLLNNTGEGATPTVYIGQDVATGASVTFANVTADLVGDVTGNVTGNVTGDVTGNADTATALETARTIQISGDVAGSASFDGTGDINITATVQADSVALGTDTTGNYVGGLSESTGVTITNPTGEGQTASIAIGQAVGTTDDVIFNTVTADLTGDVTGNADTASTLETARTIELTGDVTGSTVFDGSANVSISASLTAEVASMSELTDVDLTSAANGEILQYDGTNWVNTVQVGAEPIGHENKADSTISFNDGTRTFSISPAVTSFTVWCKGKRYVKSSTETVQIDTATGLYYIYYNSSGVLSYRTTYFDWENDTPTAYVYWNSTTSKAEFFADERHGVVLDWQTHEYLHRTQGAQIASGFGASGYVTNGDGDSDSHAQIAFAGGTFFDEDLQVDITHSATPTADTWEQVLEGTAEIPVFYRSGTVWRMDTATTFPFKAGTARAQYNAESGGSWSTADVQNNKYGAMWIVATNNLNSPVVAILGQTEGDNQSEIEERQWADLDLTDLPIFELRPLYRITFLVSDGFTNTVKAAIRGVHDLRRAVSAGTNIPAEAVSDHGSMTGLGDDDHTQYLTNERHDARDHSAAMSSVVLYDISNVGASSPSSGEFLKWNGSTWINDAVDLGTDTVGDYVQSLVAGTGITLTNNSGEGATPTVAIGQAVGTTANVTFNTVNADLTGDVTGNADTASALQTPRTIQISGDVAGSASFDGSGDINISATVQADSVALGTDTTGNYTESVTGGTGVTVTGGTGEGNTPTVAIGQAVATSDDVTFNTVTISAAPTQASHAATKSYVDGLASGIDWHEAVDLATAAALPNSPVYDNGSSGVGATLTSGTQARLVVDGANASTGDRVLVKNESTGANNGIYVVTAQGAAASSQWVLTRATDFDGGSTGEVVPGEAVLILNGSTNAKQGFVVTSTSDPHSIGSDTITFTQFTGTQAFTAGDGLTQTGNTIDVVTADSNRIVVNADSIDLATVYTGETTGASTSTIVSALTVDDYGRITAMTTGTVHMDLNDLDDVTITGASSGEFLKWDGAAWINASIPEINTLNDVGNVNITSVQDGEFLKWDSGTSKWINAAIPEINTLNDVGNVTITSATTGDILEWNGTAWVNTTLAFDDLSDVDMTSLAPSEGDVAYYDGSNWVPYALTIQNAGNVSTSGEASGDILLYDGTDYANTPHTLANITNVTLTSEADGEFLKYNGSAWVNASIPEINTLNDVGNVTITSATSGEVLQWSGSAWVNVDVLANTSLTGTPTAPTAATTTNTTQVATTAFVQQEIAALVDSAPDSLNTLNELAAALADDAAFSTTVTDSLALKAPLASPTFTGTVTLPAGTSMLHDYVTYGGNHTLVAGNEGQTLQFSATGTLTVPTNATVAFPVGTMITIFQTGTGTVTVAGAGGVTVDGAVGLKTREQWSAIVLHKRGTDTWLVTGDAKA